MTGISRRPRRRMAILTGAVATLSMMLAGCGGVLSNNGDGGGSSSGPIVLGMVVPLSGSSAASGPPMQDGAQLAVNEINAKGGVLGRKLKLDVQDGACDAKTAVAAANKLVSQGAVASVGGYCSSATLPTLPVFNKAGVTMVIPGANSDDLVNQHLPNVFLINGTGSQQSAAAVKFMDKLGVKRVATMDDNTSYSVDIAKKVAEDLGADSSGPTIVHHESVTAGENDYTANVTAVVKSDPDFVYWTGYYQEGGLIVRQLRQAGYKGPIMVADGSVDPKFVSIAGESFANGVYATMTETVETLPNAQKWVQDFKNTFHTAPGPYSAQSYDAVRVAAEGIKMAKSTDGAKISKALEQINGFQIFSGPLRFTQDHTLAKGGFQILEVKNGQFALKDRLLG